MMKRLATDILILGSGGAGLFAALHAKKAAPDLSVTVAVKGLLGKCGCTRMVQGGYNVALAPGDSAERHFMDTVEGGKFLNEQDLAWTLVTVAQLRIRELESELGCFFARNPDGTIHQKAFAGQTFDRTVEKGDLTGMEIINRLAEQVWAHDIARLEEHRAVALIRARGGDALAGVLMIDMRSGEFVFVQARAVLLATGGGPTMYKYHTPSGDKSCDGMAMALQAGLDLRDMEMVQFHPTGLLAGSETRMTGTVLEEGLRGAGGYLLGGDGRRFMHNYDPRLERATRDIVSRAMIAEIRGGNTTPNGGLWIDMRHLGAPDVRRLFKGMVERCADCGFDLAGGLVEVIPTAHYMMGGVVFAQDCTTALPGLFAAGEDTGGVHGGNPLGGNGVPNPPVFGGIPGASLAPRIPEPRRVREPDGAAIAAAIAACRVPLNQPQGDIGALRERLYELMWEDVGIFRDASGLRRAEDALVALDEELDHTGIAGDTLAFNLTWQDWLNLNSFILVSLAIASAALEPEESRVAHFRSAFPATTPDENLAFTKVWLADRLTVCDHRPLRLNRIRPRARP